jgi:hypothetical protein
LRCWPARNILDVVNQSGAASASEYVRALRVPPRPWQSLRGPENGLAYRAATRLDIDRARTLGLAGARLALLDRTQAADTSVAVVHGDGRVRLSSIGSGVFGRDYVHIRDETQDGFLYLCPSLRAFLQLPRPPLPEAATATAAAQARTAPQFTVQAVDASDQERVAGRLCQAVTLTAAVPFAVRWRIWLCGDADLRSFAQSAAAVLTGAPPAVADVVTGFGMPLRGALSFGDAVAFPEPASAFELDELVVRTVTDAEFNVPDGYTDLRTASGEPS